MHLPSLNTRQILDLVNYVPVVATIVTTLLSIILARATLRYAESADRALDLAHEEFEREWSPEVHIKLELNSNNEASIVITNLGRTSVLLELVQIRQISHVMPFERCPLNDPLVGGMTWSKPIGDRLMNLTGKSFDGTIAACVTFYAAGRLFRSDWFRFVIEVKNGKILRLDSVAAPARRVQVLSAGHSGRFRMDVVHGTENGNGDGERKEDFEEEEVQYE
jgi:hypothetical protein